MTLQHYIVVTLGKCQLTNLQVHQVLFPTNCVQINSQDPMHQITEGSKLSVFLASEPGGGEQKIIKYYFGLFQILHFRANPLRSGRRRCERENTEQAVFHWKTAWLPREIIMSYLTESQHLSTHSLRYSINNLIQQSTFNVPPICHQNYFG